MGRLQDQTAIVTGGAAGLGKAIALRLRGEGARVIITDVDIDSGTATAAQLGVDFLEQDVSDEAGWRELMTEVERSFGSVSILVNNAGILGPKDACSPEDSRLLDWRRLFAINVEGVFLGCKAAIVAMRGSGGGSIVNVASVAARLATPYATAYGASKAAVAQLTRSVAQHCTQERLGVRCNSVLPGNVHTDMVGRSMREAAQRRGVSFEAVVAEREALTPIGDFTRPEDVAAAVAFLASDDARHVTGAELVVDGGMLGCNTHHFRWVETARRS